MMEFIRREVLLKYHSGLSPRWKKVYALAVLFGALPIGILAVSILLLVYLQYFPEGRDSRLFAGVYGVLSALEIPIRVMSVVSISLGGAVLVAYLLGRKNS